MIALQLTRQGEYAIRCVLDLARNYGREHYTTKDVASKQDIPPYFLTKIIGLLIKDGLITSQRGSAGGIMLAKTPQEITLRDVVSVLRTTCSQ